MGLSEDAAARFVVHHGDNMAILPTLPDNSVDAIVTDPPAGISFMGRAWDSDKGGRDAWIAWLSEVMGECLRVLKPGGHALVWAIPRTSHWTGMAIENAGFQIRDRIAHAQATGFPKGLQVVPQLVKVVLWQLPEHARCAAQSSASIRVRSPREKAHIAVALVQILPEGALALLTEIGGEVALHVPMDTWPPGWMATIGLSMTWSWSGKLADAWNDMSKCITSTASETTTDQKTYDWLTGLHTSATTTRCSVTLRNGSKWPALTAASSSTEPPCNNDCTLLVSVLGSASWQPLGRFAGFNVALKPAIEDWWLARKPLRGTVAANVIAHGTGALNIDGCRVPSEVLTGWSGGGSRLYEGGLSREGGDSRPAVGRWPANLIHSGEPEVLAAFPQVHGAGFARTGSEVPASGVYQAVCYGKQTKDTGLMHRFGDTGSAARFFMQCPPDEATSLYYTPKASRADRDKGNKHSTVKPIALMRYLCRLITPPDGVVLDVFCGSGSTGQAAMFEGFRFIGIEQDAGHIELARHRVGLAARNGWQPGLDLGRVA